MSEGNGTVARNSVIGALATLCIGMFLHIVTVGYSTPTREEVQKAVTEVKNDARTAAENQNLRYKELQDKLEEISLKLERVSTLLEKGKNK